MAALAWQRWKHKSPEERRQDLKTAGAICLVVIGTVGFIYGGGVLLGAVSLTPSMALAGGGAVGGAVAINGAAVTEGAVVMTAGATMAGKGYSFSKSDSSQGGSGQRQTNPTRSESKVWKQLENFKNGLKRSGQGSKTQYYDWDNLHNDIEVYDSKGRHLGSMDPTTGRMYKPAVGGRTITL
jgi:hypothetical protein